MIKNYLSLVSIGLLSGVAVILLSFQDLIQGSFVSIHGFLFGLITGIYFVVVSTRNKKLGRYILWVLACGVSYAFAVMTAMSSYGSVFSHSYATSYLIGGLVGSLVVSVAYHFIFERLTLRRIITILVLGMAIPYIVRLFIVPGLSYILPLSWGDAYYWEDAPLYLLWQTVITTMLGSSLLSERSKSAVLA